MTQRVFDVENEKDMVDLWDRLNENITKIKLYQNGEAWCISNKNEAWYDIANILKINWHNKTEITRSIQEATEADSGKLCKFWNNFGEEYAIYGILSKKCNDNGITFYKIKKTGAIFDHARRLTKQEIEELC